MKELELLISLLVMSNPPTNDHYRRKIEEVKQPETPPDSGAAKVSGASSQAVNEIKKNLDILIDKSTPWRTPVFGVDAGKLEELEKKVEELQTRVRDAELKSRKGNSPVNPGEGYRVLGEGTEKIEEWDEFCSYTNYDAPIWETTRNKPGTYTTPYSVRVYRRKV